MLTAQAATFRPPYQRLLGDAMQGNGDLFGREDIVDAQWRIVENILDNATPLYTYNPGSWGPDEATQLIGADGPWRDPQVTKAEPKKPANERAGGMTEMADTVFLFDVDNTLLDNDRVQADLGAHLAEYYGEATRDRFWEIFEELRTELGYSDYLGALERYRLEAMHDPKVLRIGQLAGGLSVP